MKQKLNDPKLKMFCFRILKNYNYQQDSAGVDAEELYRAYQQVNPGKENCQLTTSELGRILRRVFPECKNARRRVATGRVHVYTNIVKATTPALNMGRIEFNQLTEFNPGFGFVKGLDTESAKEWFCFEPGSCDGHRVTKDVKIFVDWTVDVTVIGRKVELSYLGLEAINRKLL